MICLIVEITSEDIINWNPQTEVEKKKSQIANLIKLRVGDLPFMRGVGLSNEYIDKPITDIKAVLINNIKAVINDNVEDTTVLDVDFSTGETSNDFILKVVCSI